MSILTDLFSNMAELARYAPGADGVTTLDDLEAAARSARKRITTIITATVYTGIIGNRQDNEMLEALRSAMANMTLSAQLAFDAVNRRKNEVDVYKYELDAMRRAYTENYYNAMDTLLTLLTGTDETGAIGQAWRQTRWYGLISQCPVKTADEFDTVYPIDGSSLFFFRTLPIQKELIDARLGTYFDRAGDNERTGRMLRLALCKKVVATALRRFDILEFPATIRNLFDEQVTSGQRKDERDSAHSLADLLDSEAEALIGDLDALLSADTNLDVSSWSAFNQPDDNIIMMP